MFREVLRLMFPRKQHPFGSDRGLSEYMRIENVTYYEVFPPKWRAKTDGDPRVKRGK
tara:strand:- start:735 stop:905 length:171 start_codon:yes stop_codon:yes gene_type:complete